MSDLTIGDRVRIIRPYCDHNGQWGTVYEVLPWRPYPYHVRPDGWPEHQAGIAYTREELEYVATVRTLCPFCPVLLPGEPEMWEDIDDHANIAGIAACENCEVTASVFQAHIPQYVAAVAMQAEESYQDMRARMAVYIHYVQAHLERGLV